jgi:hypothetical protein
MDFRPGPAPCASADRPGRQTGVAVLGASMLTSLLILIVSHLTIFVA